MRKTAQQLPCPRLSAGIAPHLNSGTQEFLTSAVLPASCLTLYQELPYSKVFLELENMLVSSVNEV
jgi:hypothetical protein